MFVNKDSIHIMATGGDDGDFDPAPAQPTSCVSIGCIYLLSPNDEHTLCMFCLGLFHARDAFEKPGWCPACSKLTDREKGRRLARVKAYEDRSLVDNFDLRDRLSRPAPDPWPPLPRPARACSTATGARPRVPVATSQRRDADLGASPPARKVPRAGLEPRQGAPLAARRQPAPSFSFSAFRAEQSCGSGSLSFSREDLDYTNDEYDDLYAPLAPDDEWGGLLDRDRPLDDDLPSYQEPPEEYRVLDQVGYNEDDDMVAGAEDDNPDPDMPRLAPEAELPPRDEEGNDPPPRPAAEGWDLAELLKQASIRCGRTWPNTTPLRNPEDDWPGVGAKTPRGKVVLPLAQGFKKTFTATWEKPTVAPSCPKATFETELSESVGLKALATVGYTVGAYLLDPSAPRIRPLAVEPLLPTKEERDASLARGKVYTLVTAQAKHLNATSLLQGSLTAILAGMGDVPSRDEIAEIKRIHEEMIKFTWATTALAGHIATSITVAERTRWVNSNPKLDPAIRKDLLEGPIVPGGLFEGALERMALAVEKQRPACEALITFAPPPPRNQPRDLVPRQVQRQNTRQAPRQTQYRGGGAGSRQPQRHRQGRDDAERAPPRASSADARDRRPPRPADQHRRPPAAPAGTKRGANKTQRKK